MDSSRFIEFRAAIRKAIALFASAPMVAFVVILGAGATGCGYHFQRSESVILEREGVRRIYLTPLVNNSYKPGVENLVYNSLLKALTVNRYIRLVEDPALADATLSGSVSRADYGPSGAQAGADALSKLITQGVLYQSVPIATEYAAFLDCSFSLTRRNPKAGQKAVIWSGNFSRNKPFTASNQLGVFGTTSSLVNESEFERTLGDLAQSMMGDLRESMLSRF